jgi:TonB-dependent starch-binding outer membrane protein SusC
VAEGITARASVGLDQLNNRGRSYDSPVFGLFASTGGSAQFGNTYLNKTTFEGTVNMNRAFGDVHEFSGVIGSSYEDNIDEWHQVTGQQFPTEYFRYLTSAAQITAGNSQRNDWTLLSFFGRASYTWNQRVTATFNVRRDGSSRFGADNRFGTFPSASLLWRLSEEPFMQDQTIFDNLALRVSYGRRATSSRWATSRPAGCSAAARATTTCRALRRRSWPTRSCAGRRRASSTSARTSPCWTAACRCRSTTMTSRR